MWKGVQLAVFLIVIAGLRCASAPQVFVDGGVYFVDADCYSRMTRVREVWEHPGRIIRHHDFENWPDGTTPHTTAPLDYLIAGLALVLRPFTSQPLDVAGALVSPLLGMAGGVFLWFWCGCRPYRGAMMLLYAVSPGLIHATALGRPDHQSLLVALLAVAIGATVKKSALWAGLAWGLALWVSLYEPAVLLVAVLALCAVFWPGEMFRRERLAGVTAMCGVLAVALLLEGWRVGGLENYDDFSRWLGSIGEAGHGWMVPFAWAGWGVILMPVLLLLRHRNERWSVPLLLLMCLLLGLTWWQARWGYFLVLVFAMSLPWQFRGLRPTWAVWVGFVALLWPAWRELDGVLFPEGAQAAAVAERRVDAVMLRESAEFLAAQPPGGVLAPWWQSPALVYWSGKPAVAGSSHESLAGIRDSMRFYLSENAAEAGGILHRRKVRYVVAYDDGRVVMTSIKPLGVNTWTDRAMASVLYRHPHSAPSFLRPVFANSAFKVFEVQNE